MLTNQTNTQTNRRGFGNKFHLPTLLPEINMNYKEKFIKNNVSVQRCVIISLVRNEDTVHAWLTDDSFIRCLMDILNIPVHCGSKSGTSEDSEQDFKSKNISQCSIRTENCLRNYAKSFNRRSTLIRAHTAVTYNVIIFQNINNDITCY